MATKRPTWEELQLLREAYRPHSDMAAVFAEIDALQFEIECGAKALRAAEKARDEAEAQRTWAANEAAKVIAELRARCDRMLEPCAGCGDAPSGGEDIGYWCECSEVDEEGVTKAKWNSDQREARGES